MKLLLILLSSFYGVYTLADPPIVSAQPVANPAPTPPLQLVNNGIQQVNNNAALTQATPAYTPEPSVKTGVTAPDPQAQQVVLPYPLETTRDAVTPPSP